MPPVSMNFGPQNCGAVPRTSVQDQGAGKMFEDYSDFPMGSDFLSSRSITTRTVRSWPQIGAAATWLLQRIFLRPSPQQRSPIGDFLHCRDGPPQAPHLSRDSQSRPRERLARSTYGSGSGYCPQRSQPIASILTVTAATRTISQHRNRKPICRSASFLQPQTNSGPPRYQPRARVEAHDNVVILRFSTSMISLLGKLGHDRILFGLSAIAVCLIKPRGEGGRIPIPVRSMLNGGH